MQSPLKRTFYVAGERGATSSAPSHQRYYGSSHRRLDHCTLSNDKRGIKQFLPCHMKYSQSECRKAVEKFHQTFPTISAIQLYHTQPSHLATVFTMTWYKIIMQLFLVVLPWNIPLVTFFGIHTRLKFRVYIRKYK